MTMQMETTERVNSTQKNNAAAYKKQKDDLEKENALIREDLRRKEEELNNRLESDETAKRKVRVYTGQGFKLMVRVLLLPLTMCAMLDMDG